jgi:hypothetical protein
MSAKARLLWTIPALLVASWLTVRSLAASPAHDRSPATRDGLGDPPVPFAALSRELHDPALSRYIRGQAAQALGD